MDKSSSTEPADDMAALIEARRTTLPRRLEAPGPTMAQLQALFRAAASAPDHGQLTPWRFVIVPGDARAALGEAFAMALRQRDATARAEELARAREKAFRAPLLMLAVVDGETGDTGIDLTERLVSAGCAIQNLLLMATAQGFGSALTSGKAMGSQPLRALFALAPRELALCFISIGTVQSTRPERVRPQPRAFVSTLGVGAWPL